MKMKKVYVPSTVQVTVVVLESGMVATSSPINPNGIRLEDWESATPQEEVGDIWLPI